MQRKGNMHTVQTCMDIQRHTDKGTHKDTHTHSEATYTLELHIY